MRTHKILNAANKWRDAYNPLRSLTISRAISLQEAYNRGEMADLQWLYAHIEQADPDLLAIVERRIAALQEFDWNIKIIPPNRRHATFDRILAEEQAAALRAEYERKNNLYAAIEHLSMAAFRGFSVIEPQGNEFACFDHWNVVRDGYSGGWKYNPDAKSCSFASLPEGNTFDPEYCLIRTVTRRINYYALYKYIRSNLSAKDWDAFIEIYGLPGCVIILPENVPADKVDEYRSAAEEVASGGSGALPSGSIASFSDSPRGVNPFRDHMQYLREQLVLAGTGGLLTMLSMPQGIGSGSSEEHGDAFQTIARGEARRISEIFQRQFDTRLLNSLFPGRPVLAYFEIAANEEVDVGKIVDNVLKLSQAGFQIDPDQISEQTGYKLTLKPEPAAPAFGMFGNRSIVKNREPAAMIAAELGVDPEWIAPVADLLAPLAEGKPYTAEQMAELLEQLALRLPEMFSQMDVQEFADVLERGMGQAVIEGVRDGLRQP